VCNVLQVDVLLLADIFENFREIMLKNFQIDPAHYVSAPHFAWNAMLKLTKANIELISDTAMYEMLSSSIRGGLCQINTRYASPPFFFSIL